MPTKTKTAGRPINTPTAAAAGLAGLSAAADRMADSLARWLAPRILAGLAFVRDAFAAWSRELAREIEHNSRPAAEKKSRRRRPVIVTARVVRPAPVARALPTCPRVPRLNAPACSSN
jgi:hypothetical protein